MRTSQVSSEFEEGHHSYLRLSLGEFFERRSEALGCLGNTDEVKRVRKKCFLLFFGLNLSYFLSNPRFKPKSDSTIKRKGCIRLYFELIWALQEVLLFVPLAFIWLCHRISREEGTICVNFPVRLISCRRPSWDHHHTQRSRQNSQPRSAQAVEDAPESFS